MSRTDLVPPRVSRVALLGGGDQAAELLGTIRTLCPTGERLRVIAVCDADPRSPALSLAREAGVPHVGRLAAEVLGHDDVDVVVDLRDVAEPGLGVADMLPRGVQVLGSQGVDLLLNMLELTRDSERAHADDRAELDDTRARLDQFMEFAPISIYMKDTDLAYRVMNRTALDLLGLERDEVLGKSDFDIFPAAVARRIRARERQVLEDLQPATFNGVLPLPNGERMYFSATFFPVVRQKKPIGLFGLIEDITELHDSERLLLDQRVELVETREELKGILENSLDIIFITRPDGRLQSWNNSAEEVFGADRDEAVGTRVHEYAVEGDTLTGLVAQAVSEGHAASYDLKLYRRGGGEIVTNVSLTRVNDPMGRPTELVGIARNITERLQLQEDLIQTERLAAIGKMAAGVAHEINNPLTIIEAIAGVLEDLLSEKKGALDEETWQELSEGIAKLYVQTSRCTSITHNLLGFARRSASTRRLVSVADVLDQSLDLLRPEANRLSLRVERRYARAVPEIVTDPQLLEQIFVNLLKNAMDAIEERRPGRAIIELFVSLLEDPGDESMRVAATITDNGVGIPEENLSQVFDLFYTSKPAGKGTGLGLSIVHNILKKIGGEIRLESTHGEGSSFTVLLPLELGALDGLDDGADPRS